MKNSDDKFSRLDRMKKQRGDKILNVLIAFVAVGIIITAFVIFLGGNKDQSAEKDSSKKDETVEQAENAEKEVSEKDNALTVVEEDEESNEEAEEQPEQDQSEEEHEEMEITTDSDDPAVSQSIVNPAWKPIGTEQTGEHVSLYDGTSTDWQEKVKALSYTTGLSEDNMTIWRIQNGGSPQKSIGIVSAKDTNEKYRVYLEWVDQEGWKPVKMDVLNR